MIGMNIDGTIYGVEAASRQDVNNWLREGFGVMGDAWHRYYRRTHFSTRASNKYGYAKRAKSYNRRKRRIFGHTIPLVLSGESRSLSETRKIKATKRSVTIRMPVRAFNFKPKNSSVNMRKEFLATTRSEDSDLARRANRRVTKKINEFRKSEEF